MRLKTPGIQESFMWLTAVGSMMCINSQTMTIAVYSYEMCQGSIDIMLWGMGYYYTEVKSRSLFSQFSDWREELSYMILIAQVI